MRERSRPSGASGPTERGEPTALVDRAVVVMGKLPRPGRVKTRLGLAPEAAAALYRAFLADGVARVDAAFGPDGGRRVFACALEEDEPLEAARRLVPSSWAVVRQADGDLGHRMRHAWRSGQARSTLVIGSDLPELPARSLRDAFARLEAGSEARVVLVPATDGGYVLVGMRRDHAAPFEAVPWSTAEVLAVTRARIEAAGLELQLVGPPVPDVDRPEDLRRLRSTVAADSETGRALARWVPRPA